MECRKDMRLRGGFLKIGINAGEAEDNISHAHHQDISLHVSGMLVFLVYLGIISHIWALQNNILC